MRNPISAGTGLAMLAVVQAATLPPAWSQAAVAVQPASAAVTAPAPKPAAPFSGELQKQDAIYQSKGDQTVEGYTIDRGLVEYNNVLRLGFDNALEGLGPTDRWLDIGAGRAYAILDYLSTNFGPYDAEGRERRMKKAAAVAVSIEDRRTPRWQQLADRLEAGSLQYLYDKRLGEYSAEQLGRFQLITDVIGGFSYSVNLSPFMEKVLSLLEVNGSFFTVLQDVRAEHGQNQPHYKNAPFLTEMMNADGSELRVCAWLKSISCVEVTCEYRTGWIPPVESYRVRKTCNDVAVPALETVHYAAGTPPERRYQVKAAATAVAQPVRATPAAVAAQPAPAATPVSVEQRIEAGKQPAAKAAQ